MPLVKVSRDKLFGKLPVILALRRFCRRTLNYAIRTHVQMRRALVRSIFSIPLLSKCHPHRKIIRCINQCHEVHAFPDSTDATCEDWSITIRGREAIHRVMPTGLDGYETRDFYRSALRYQRGNYFEIPHVFLACLHRAKVYSQDLLVLTARNNIFFESALSKDEVLNHNGILDRLFCPPARYMPGDYCLLSSPWSDGYYHWMIEALPRMSLIERFTELSDTPLIVQSRLRSYQQDTLDMLGVSSKRIVNFTGGCWQLGRLYYPELLSETGNPSPHAVHWLRRRFLTRPEPSTLPVKPRLYITRRDAKSRRIVNEAEIVEYLHSEGFEILCPGTLSVAQQIQIFSKAEIVIAAHGAGCTNMVFAPHNALLIELFGANYINGCFWALTNILNQRYAFLTGPPTDRLNYTISLDRLKTLLARELSGIKPVGHIMHIQAN